MHILCPHVESVISKLLSLEISEYMLAKGFGEHFSFLVPVSPLVHFELVENRKALATAPSRTNYVFPLVRIRVYAVSG